MTDNIERRQAYQPAMPNNQLREAPPWWSKEYREIALSNKNTRIRANEQLNSALLADQANELRHEVKNREAEHRKNNLERHWDRQETLINGLERRANGNMALGAEYYESYQVWKANELYHLATDTGRGY